MLMSKLFVPKILSKFLKNPTLIYVEKNQKI